MALKRYELAYVLQPNLADDAFATHGQRIGETVKGLGGEIGKVNVWGRRRLAYPIDGFREGYYVIAQMQLPPEGVVELDRALKLNEAVIRHLVVRLDK